MIRLGPVVRAVVAVVAAIAMVSLGARFRGALPDLVLLVVVAAALVSGPLTGALLGLLAGWVVDIVPPGAIPLGASALGYAAAGAVAGRCRRIGARSLLWAAIAVTAGTVTVLGARGLAVAWRGAPVPWVESATVLGLTLLAAPFVIPGLVALDRVLARRRLG